MKPTGSPRCGVDFCPFDGVHQAYGPPSRAQFFCDEEHRPTWLDLRGAEPKGAGSCCFYCGHQTKHRQRTKDHVIPTARGGSRLRHNVVTACNDCNQLKGLLTGEEFLDLLPQGRGAVKQAEGRLQAEYRAGRLNSVPPETDLYVQVMTVLAQNGFRGESAEIATKDLILILTKLTKVGSLNS